MNNKLVGFALAGLVFLPGCLQVPPYKAKPLNILNNDFVYRAVKNNIVFQAKCLTHGELYYLFGERTKELLESTEVIYCSIHNISGQDYVFSLKNQDFSALQIRDVKKLIKTSSTSRFATGIIGGTGISAVANVLFLGSCMVLIDPMIILCGAYALIIGVPLGTAIVAIPFFGKAIKSMIMNNRIDRDLKDKILQGDVVIKSGDKCEGLIFARASDYVPQFSIAMHEKNNSKNKIVFDVDLQKPFIGTEQTWKSPIAEYKNE